jgi:hypothetical protein
MGVVPCYGLGAAIFGLTELVLTGLFPAVGSMLPSCLIYGVICLYLSPNTCFMITCLLF